LERLYTLESPGLEDPGAVLRVEARKVGVYKRPTNAPSNGTITE
jgi:hypothetical protein